MQVDIKAADQAAREECATICDRLAADNVEQNDAADCAYSIREIERVARAICAACDDEPDNFGVALKNAYRWQDYAAMAQAAIDAMQECAEICGLRRSAMTFDDANEQWESNDDWRYADREAERLFFFNAGKAEADRAALDAADRIRETMK